MLDREPFLKAIFAEPESDLPRLVFADYLDDHGDHRWAELIRIQCQFVREPANPALAAREEQLLSRPPLPYFLWHRGLPAIEVLKVTAADLTDPDAFRTYACETAPHRYGATDVMVTDGRVGTPAVVETLLTSPVLVNVTTLWVAGREEQLGTARDESLGIGLIDFVYRPSITPRMVEHLCGMREARRLVALGLTNNDLDNDAVRALARSNYLTRLTELAIQDGNPRVKGRVWSELLARFGPEVVR